MAITLGAITFDPARTRVREKHAETGGHLGRHIEISGTVLAENAPEEVEAALDAILAAASNEDFTAALSLRDGRRLFVRRAGFTREVCRDSRAGAFVLDLESRDPFEEAAIGYSLPWAITASGATKSCPTLGNAPTAPVFHVGASGTLVNPGFSDGARTIRYWGSINPATTLTFDGAARKVIRDGLDATAYTTGEFPAIFPGNTTITYTDDPASSHQLNVFVVYADRWW